MAEHRVRDGLRSMTGEVVGEALGLDQRADPVLPTTGGPGGNARLTAWTGLCLLVLFAADLVTLIDVRGLISPHVVIGVLLAPPALLKTASTGWRILRYYTGNRPYRTAGPPPMPLRMLGPLVVLGTLAVLGTGLALIALGPDGSRRPLVTVLSFGVDAVQLHKAAFVAWAVLTGLHTLLRLLPAVRLTVADHAAVPGRAVRMGVIAATMAVAVLAAALLWGPSGSWRSAPDRHIESTGHLHRHAHR